MTHAAMRPQLLHRIERTHGGSMHLRTVRYSPSLKVRRVFVTRTQFSYRALSCALAGPCIDTHTP